MGRTLEGAQYSEADVQSDQIAAIGQDVTLLLADDVTVSASHERDLDAVGDRVEDGARHTGGGEALARDQGDRPVEASPDGLVVVFA